MPMVDLKGTSWQQRYAASQIYTLRCKINDVPGMSARLIEAFGKVDAHMGDIHFIEVQDQFKIRDFTIYIANEAALEALKQLVEEIDGIEILDIRDEIMHTHHRGSIDVVSRMKIKSLTDLRMVYTPGVASVCKKIEADPEAAYEYTGLCDRVAIVTNGTAVLGLGDIGVVPSLPVMEGKASIFAEFVNVSAVPILIDTKDVDKFVDTVVQIAPSFGAIQLEDVAAPMCFEIEEKLLSQLDIPVFHDDQHGTATVVLAALINALKQVGKNCEDCTVVMLGAGAAGIAISKMLNKYGIKDIVVYDSFGPIYRGRTEKMNPYKEQLAQITNRDNLSCPLIEGFKGRDIFIGVARPHMVSSDMIAAMAEKAIALPLSNPVGEISKEEAIAAGAAIAADGRDINNALAYPGIFRGTLDARCKSITMEMKIAAAERIAEIAPGHDLMPDMLDRAVHQQVALAVEDAAKRP